MNCPICPGETMVLKTLGPERRRQCVRCKHRFTTTEVLKDDQLRQAEAVQAVIEVAEKLKAAA